MRWLALTLCWAAGAAAAAEVAGVDFPDEQIMAGQRLLLNGAGVREYGWIGLDIYAAGLYLPVRSTDAAAVLDMAGPKLLVMHLFHGASHEDAVKAWAPYFEGNCKPPCALPRTQLDAFNALLPGTQKGDVQIYLFEGDAVTLTHNGRTLGRIEGAGFARLLLATWIGQMPTTENLKRALLGAYNAE